MKMIKESNYMYVLRRIKTTQLYSHVTSSSLKQQRHQRQQEAAPHVGSDIKEARERERESEGGEERVTQVLLRVSSVDTYCTQ
jgi:hypothetical protein